MRLSGSFVCADLHLIDVCLLRAIPAHAESQSANGAPRRLRSSNEGDGARERGEGRRAASAPERSEGVDRPGCPLGGAVNNAECMRVVEAAGTTLTGV